MSPTELREKVKMELMAALMRVDAVMDDGVCTSAESVGVPVGYPMFLQILDEMRQLHIKKGADYGTDNDTFSNMRDSQEFGISPVLGAILRANDKMQRLKTFANKGVLANESLEDSLIDLASYAVIALVLYREQKGCCNDADDCIRNTPSER